ncbi:S9 family peptidase [candidate division KSB1 bacterium]|nr:S9 family peptidase [candidate division KSB1 bacterium]
MKHRFLLFILLLTSSGLAQMEKGKLALNLYLEMEGVSDPQISPDGAQIIYTRQWVDKMNDSRESSLWIMNADGSKNRFLIDGSSPQWSPDGSRLAFLAKGKPQGTQLFVRWMDAEGAVTQLTHVEKSPSNIRWSPDGKWLAFNMLVPEKDRWEIKLPPKPEGGKWTEGPKIIDRLNYRRDRQGFLEEGFRHVFIVPSDGGTPRQLTSGDYDHNSPEWTPDGREILVSGLRVENAEYQWRESEIYAVNVEAGVITQLTKRKGPDSNPMPSPDGKYVAYVGHDFTDDTFYEQKLYCMNRDGSNPREIAANLDRTPGGLIWANDSKGVYFNISDRGTRNLYFTTLQDKVQQITKGNHLLNVSGLDRSGKVVGTLSASHQPGDVAVFSLKTPQQINELTAVNDDVLHGVKLGAVEELWYKSVDDFDIQGWIVKPPSFDPAKKYPLILTIHGGPHAMFNVGFNFGWQHFAAKGYVVLYTNPRGSSGYGSAFGNAIKNTYPGKDYDDLMKGVDQVIAKGYIDEKNLFVYGGSGGGVLTAWIVGHTDRFAAASSNFPVINWMSFVGTTDGASWYRNFKQYPWEDPSEHLERSPLMYAENVKTPTMLMTGVNDLRTPISQTEEFYMALKVRKVPTVMLRFNDEWHGTSSKPSNAMRSILYMESWFEKHARKEAQEKSE